MHANNLHLMQDGFRRSQDSLEAMIEFVVRGGIYDQETLSGRSPGRHALIVLNKFEDGRFFVHDGLHRVASIFKGRTSGLLEASEFQIQDFTYQQYNEINLEAGYFTPFDPQSEVRIADLSEFKSQVRQLIKSNEDPTPFIEQHKPTFARQRRAHHDSIEALLNFHGQTKTA